MRQMSREVVSGAYTRPKTVLAFFGIVLAIAVAGAVGLVAVVGRYDLAETFIWVALVFVAVIFIAILFEVFRHIRRDPTRLMLGEMSGREFAEYQRMTMGDSLTGEVVETTALDGRVLTDGTPSLPQGGEESGGG